MKISTKGRYGLRILLDLALHDSDSPRLIRDIASSQKLSEKYVSRLIIALRKKGLVKSIRGAHGGYKLKKFPEKITLLEIYETMEGALSIVDCVACPRKCKSSDSCVARRVWSGLNDKVKEAFEQITLQDVIENNQQGTEFDFCI